MAICKPGLLWISAADIKNYSTPFSESSIPNLKTTNPKYIGADNITDRRTDMAFLYFVKSI
jgi:hypothetical protein